MPTCAVSGCPTGRGLQRIHDGISLHRFPCRDKERLDMWMELMNRGKDWQPTNRTVICSLHFVESDFKTVMEKTKNVPQKRRLKSEAVPSVFPKAKLHGKKSGRNRSLKIRLRTRSDNSKAMSCSPGSRLDEDKNLHNQSGSDYDENSDDGGLDFEENQEELESPSHIDQIEDGTIIEGESFEEEQYLNEDMMVKKCLNRTWYDDSSKDLRLMCAGKKQLMVHSALFACVSSFVRDLLDSVYQQGCLDDEGCITLYLPDYSYENVELLVSSCYLKSSVNKDNPMLNDPTFMENLIQLCGDLQVEQHLVPLVVLRGAEVHVPDPEFEDKEKRRSVRLKKERSSLGEEEQFTSISWECDDFDEVLDNGDEFGDSRLEIEVHDDGPKLKNRKYSVKPRKSEGASRVSSASLGEPSNPLNEAGKSQLCPYCGEKFTCPILMKYHVFREEKRKPYPCKVEGCNFGAFSASGLTTHVKNCHNDENEQNNQNGDNAIGFVKCDLCNARVKGALIEKHKFHYHDDTVAFKCDLCPFRDLTEEGVASHNKTSHSKKPKKWKCECGVSYEKKLIYIKHKRYACPMIMETGGGFALKCDKCSYSTDYYRALAVHKVKEHKDIKRICKCGQTFKSEVCYRRHRRHRCNHFRKEKKEVQQQPEEMVKCNKCYRLVPDLAEHDDQAHDETRPFSCNICSWRFDSKWSLSRHLGKEHREQKFVCVCGDKFHLYETYYSHKRHRCPVLKNDEKPADSEVVKCKLCDLTVYSKLALQLHNAKNHLERKFKCQCGAEFLNRVNLNLHIRKRCKLTATLKETWLKCDECSFRARSQRAISCHLSKEHGRGERFGCECGVQYTRKYKLNAHKANNCPLNSAKAEATSAAIVTKIEIS